MGTTSHCGPIHTSLSGNARQRLPFGPRCKGSPALSPPNQSPKAKHWALQPTVQICSPSAKDKTNPFSNIIRSLLGLIKRTNRFQENGHHNCESAPCPCHAPSSLPVLSSVESVPCPQWFCWAQRRRAEHSFVVPIGVGDLAQHRQHIPMSIRHMTQLWRMKLFSCGKRIMSSGPLPPMTCHP